MSLDLEFEHEELQLFRDPATGATGVVAIHSTALGPAMGGLRFRAYDSLTAATLDALRLARAMTLKNAAAGLDLGGGKGVLIDGLARADRAAVMRAFGKVVERLGGRYVTAEDVGTTPADMQAIGSVTRWVAGRPVGAGGRGDPAPSTARTVLGAIAAAAELRLAAPDLEGVRVGVLGVGQVGSRLAAMLRASGASVTLSDIDAARAQSVAQDTGGVALPVEGFVRSDVDVLAPCALGGAIAPQDVPELRCKVVAGAANNPLADPRSAADLHAAGILYVPDFLANCGGIIHVGAEVLGFDEEEADRRIEASIARTAELLGDAVEQDRPPLELGVELAERRLERAKAAAP